MSCRIYNDRQGLNMRVMALLMASQQPAADAAVQSGNLPEQRAAELQRALAALRRNLQEEQRLEAEHHHTVFRKILNSVQVRITCLPLRWL